MIAELRADRCRAFLRNPERYPDPENYRPERWIEPGWPTYQEPLTQFPTIKGMSSFGWGQRQCLGMTLTQDEMVVACGAIMWCFNLRAKKNPMTGEDFPVPLDKSNSLLIIKPDPFNMAFEPRSEERKQKALHLWKESEAQDLRQRAEFLALSGEVVDTNEGNTIAKPVMEKVTTAVKGLSGCEKQEVPSSWITTVEVKAEA